MCQVMAYDICLSTLGLILNLQVFADHVQQLDQEDFLVGNLEFKAGIE